MIPRVLLKLILKFILIFLSCYFSLKVLFWADSYQVPLSIERTADDITLGVRLPVHQLPVPVSVPLPLSLQFQIPQVQNTSKKREKLFECEDVKGIIPQFTQRGPYWVLSNYIRASRTFACDESITVTTHGDYTFLDHVVPLLERWRGPISMTIYTPGSDFGETVDQIHLLRECGKLSSLVKELVTFHIFFDDAYVKKMNPPPPIPTSCNPYLRKKRKKAKRLFRKKAKLLYPINVARNIAREMSTTFLVLALDVELYPRPNFIPDFFDMLRKNPQYIPKKEAYHPHGSMDLDNVAAKKIPFPQVFVLPVFEVQKKVSLDNLPKVKSELQKMYKQDLIKDFHFMVCKNCHIVPNQTEWLQEPSPGSGKTNELSVFTTAHRFGAWEPFFVGTKFDPPHDERLTWEGQANKLTQAYIFCLLNTSFHILNNAFVLHHPGIRKSRQKGEEMKVTEDAQRTLIRYKIMPQMRRFYGKRAVEKCVLYI